MRRGPRFINLQKLRLSKNVCCDIASQNLDHCLPPLAQAVPHAAATIDISEDTPLKDEFTMKVNLNSLFHLVKSSKLMIRKCKL
jgi:hypothetical protein